jgi:uncharacterized protein YcbK (DUF882 family)
VTIHRRHILAGLGAATLLSVGGFPVITRAAAPPVRPKSLALFNTHTGERFQGTFFETDYLPDALAELNRVLRDHRTGDVHEIDRGLFDWMVSLRERLEGSEFGIISGYRSPTSNEGLRANSGGVAKKSLHMQGRAIDLRLSGAKTAAIRDLARGDRRGGVGYYAESDFVHIDTGRVRSW